MNSRTKLPALSALLVLLAGCTATPQGPAQDAYFIGSRPVRADREYLHRYRCTIGTPLMCQCDSLHHGECFCHC